nr:uncharacterized protein LOC105335516 isoform X2 [Crassostrea gigas]
MIKNGAINLMGSSSSTRKRHSDVTSASRSSPHFGVLALVNRRSPQTEQPKEPSDKDTENAKISVAKLYEQRYRPAFRGIGAQYNDLFQTKPLPKAAARTDVGLVFRVRRSALNIHPFNDTEAPQRIKENTISIMNDNPDLQSICRHFQGKKSS